MINSTSDYGELINVLYHPHHEYVTTISIKLSHSTEGLGPIYGVHFFWAWVFSSSYLLKLFIDQRV